MGDATLAVRARSGLVNGKVAPRVGSKIKSRIGGKIDRQQVRRVSQDFEAFFLSRMMQPMFEGIKAEKPFGGGPAEDMWRTLQVDEYGKAIARSGGIGIADAVFKEIIKSQEGAQK